MKQIANAAIGPVPAVMSHALRNDSKSEPCPTTVIKTATPMVAPICLPTWFREPPTENSDGGT
jgi:hypothetical protein